MADTGDLKTLPLDAMHREAGARFGAFAGWSMPLTYPDGVMKEHLHTRQKAGLFDISHMKLFLVTGAGAAAMLARACPFDPHALADGQSKYTFLLNEAAGIIDDLIVTRLANGRFMVVANAGNAEIDEAHLKAVAADFEVRLEPLDRVFLALQGPQAEDVLSRAGLDLSGLIFMRGTEPRKNWFATRSGYTGEDGFEIALPAAEAALFVERLLADERVRWIGLAARDSLRLEAGLCLHGQDIDQETTPAEAALMWAVPPTVREKGGYIGAPYLTGGLAKVPQRKRVGLKPEDRQPVRAGTVLFDEGGGEIGYVTSGGFGPSFGAPVAMGYVAAHAAKAGTRLLANVRGKRLPVEIHTLPFTPHRYRKG
jgi:aminomethyltransferase